MTKAIQEMSKKELKDHINTNGFFFHIQCDKISKDDMEGLLTDAVKETGGKVTSTGNEVPTGDNIIVFKGIASQNYGKGEKSRNGYKYDQNGWDYSAYKVNAAILWQHNTEYGGIGKANSLWIDKAGNQNILFYVDTDTLEPRNAIQVQRGFVTAISTGAIAKEYGFEENDTGTMYEESDAEEKFGWENVMRAFFGASDVLTLVVTKAEMIENSLVTIGSNENAIAMQNAIGNHFQEVGERYKRNHLKDDVEVISTEAGTIVKTTSEEKETVTDNSETTDQTIAEPVKAEETTQEETKQVAQPTESTQEGAESTVETPAPVEQTEAETEEETNAKESAAKLADALEQIATQANTISEMKAQIEADKVETNAFKEDIYDTLSKFITSHNGAVDSITEIQKNLTHLSTTRVSKGLPHVRQNEVGEKKSLLTDVVKQIKRND